MRGVLGLILSLIGGAVIVFFVIDGVRALGGMYAGALSDPLGQPEGAETAVADRMKHDALMGAIGVPPLVAGGVLLKVAFVQRMRKRR